MVVHGPNSITGSPIIRHEFTVGTDRIFNKIHFCAGRVIYMDKSEINVKFVSYESYDAAKKVFDRYSPLNDDGVVRVWSIGDAVGSVWEKRDGFHVVSFGEFEGFFSECMFADREALLSTGPAGLLTGIPPSWVVFIIKELIKAFKYLFLMGYSGRLLDLPVSYVWCFDVKTNKYKLKVFLVDEVKTDYEADFWSWVLQDSVSCFGQFLEKHIIVHPCCLSLRKCFLDGVDPGKTYGKQDSMPPMKRLCMLETSPFLTESLPDIVETVRRANLILGKSNLEGYDVKNLKIALGQAELFNQICPNGHWTLGISGKFRKYLDERMLVVQDRLNKDKPEHKWVYLTHKNLDNDLPTLIQWLRKPYEHQRMFEGEIYSEVISGDVALPKMMADDKGFWTRKLSVLLLSI